MVVLDQVKACVIELNKTWKTRYWQLLVNRKEIVGIKKIKKNPKTFTNNWWCLWKFKRLQSNKEKDSINSVWWYDSRYGILFRK